MQITIYLSGIFNFLIEWENQAIKITEELNQACLTNWKINHRVRGCVEDVCLETFEVPVCLTILSWVSARESAYSLLISAGPYNLYPFL